MPEVQANPPDRILFETRDLTIGSFSVQPDDPLFSDSGPTQGDLFVFPSSAVWIEDRDRQPFVADRTLATFYNRGHLYRRRALSSAGDHSIWIRLGRGEIRSALKRREIRGGASGPYGWRRRPVSAATYRLLTTLLRYLGSRPEPDSPLVETTSVRLLEELVSPPSGGAPVSAAHRALAERTRALLDHNLSEPLPLASIAEQIGVSPFHLARVFRSCVGVSIHAYRDQLRLRVALQEVEHAQDLTDLALDLGFSSHSHFSDRFRRAFGVTPSRFRASEHLDRSLRRLTANSGERDR